MIAEATLTSKGQLTLPKPVRDALGLQTGDKVIFSIRENRIELEVPSNSILDWYGATADGETQDHEAVREKVRANIAKEVVREGTGD